MAATNALTTGSTTASSSDITLTTLTIACLKGTSASSPSSPMVTVMLKDDGGAYNPVDFMDGTRRSLYLPAGVYRFDRVAGTCGVFTGA